MTDARTGVALQFDDPRQRREAASLGMWAFLATEILFFGVLFACYAVSRVRYPDAFAAAGRHTDVLLGTVETAVLMISSFTMALAVRSVRLGGRASAVALLVATLLLGVAFLGIHGVEYYHEYDEHLVPTLDFAFEGADPRHADRASARCRAVRQGFVRDRVDRHGRAHHPDPVRLGRLCGQGVRGPAGQSRKQADPGADLLPGHPAMIRRDIASIGTYVKALVALLALVLATVAAAYLPWGPLRTPIVYGIGLVETALVMSYFMHLAWSSRITILFAVAGFFWLAFLVVLSLTDFLTRPPIAAPW